jgi:hypothetical protein
VNLPSDVARRYFVEDLPGATVAGARLQGVLHNIDDGGPLSVYALAFLEKQGLVSLHALASGLIPSEEFRNAAAAEQNARLIMTAQLATAATAAAEKRAADGAAAASRLFTELESDPVRRRRREAQQLRERFGIGYVDTAVDARVITLLKRLVGGQRLSPEEVIWLSTDTECWTPEVRAAHHRLEAIALTEEWRGTDDPWTAITACSHWRKAEAPEEALGITATLLELAGLSSKLQSAMRTTRGGAMRDLGRLKEASDLGYEAHRLNPTDFRPCTLLGAISMTQGDFGAGHEWYAKAEELGAEPHAVDQDIRGVLHRCLPEIRDALRESLLARDLQRFAWVRSPSQHSPLRNNSLSTR